MKSCDLESKFVFQENYCTGEPSVEMIETMLANDDENIFSRVIAVGVGTVIYC